MRSTLIILKALTIYLMNEKFILGCFRVNKTDHFKTNIQSNKFVTCNSCNHVCVRVLLLYLSFVHIFPIKTAGLWRSFWRVVNKHEILESMTLQIIYELPEEDSTRRFNSRASTEERIKLQTNQPIDSYSQHDRLQRIAFNGRLIVRVVARFRINGHSWDRLVQSQRRSTSSIGGQFRRVFSVGRNFVKV